MAGIQLEEFGPKAFKLDGIIIPADEIKKSFVNDDPNGIVYDYQWVTPIENHHLYTLALFMWTDESLLEYPKYSVIEDPYVIIEMLAEYPCEDNLGWDKVRLEYRGKKYYHQWADLCTGEGDIENKWVRRVSGSEVF